LGFGIGVVGIWSGGGHVFFSVVVFGLWSVDCGGGGGGGGGVLGPPDGRFSFFYFSLVGSVWHVARFMRDGAVIGSLS